MTESKRQKTGGRAAGTLNKRTIEGQDACARYAQKALKTLVAVMENSESDVAKVKAANSILDRAWGRSPQAIEILRTPDRTVWTPETYKKHFGLSDAEYELLRKDLHEQV